MFLKERILAHPHMMSVLVSLIQSPESFQFRFSTFVVHCSFDLLHICHRSSDSDGAFETPESTTPVKAVSPAECQILQLPSEGTVPVIHKYLIMHS